MLRFTDFDLACETAIRAGHGVHKFVVRPGPSRTYTFYNVLSNSPLTTSEIATRHAQIAEDVAYLIRRERLVSYEFIQCPVPSASAAPALCASS